MKTSAPIRVLTVDDHPLLLEGLATVIDSQMDMVLVGQACNCRDAIQKYRELQPDVTLMDLRLPDMSGIDALTAIQSQFPGARIIMMTTFEGDGPMEKALAAGARSYILKTMPPREMLDTIRQVHAGKKRLPEEICAKVAEHVGNESLTQREVDVLQQTVNGSRNRDIAYKLFIAEETVKGHMKHIMRKLEACDRTDAVMIAARRGFIHF
jgi:DNA-binding NarL/FixJ family response regulator